MLSARAGLYNLTIFFSQGMRQCFTALPEEGKDPGIPEGSVLYAFSDYYLHCNMGSLFEADHIN